MKTQVQVMAVARRTRRRSAKGPGPACLHPVTGPRRRNSTCRHPEVGKCSRRLRNAGVIAQLLGSVGARMRPPLRLPRSPLALQAFLAALLAAGVSLALLWRGPAGADLAAHVYQRSLYLQHGLSLWNNFWYAGRYSFITYSVLYYPLAAGLHIDPLTVLTVGVSAAAFIVVLERQFGRSARWSAWSFALIWPAGVVVSGVLPFALGMALALCALVALQGRRVPWFAALAGASLLASPLAFLILMLPLAGVAIAQRTDWRKWTGPVLIVVAILVAEGVLWRLFPDGGRYPFWGDDFTGTVVFCLVGITLSWRVERASTLRWLFVVYGVVAVGAFVVSSDLGSNIARLRLAAIPLGLLVLPMRRWKPWPICLAALGLAAYWNVAPIATTYANAASDPSGNASYWQPAINWFHGHLSPDYRVEAVDTVGHWPAVFFPQADIPLARGWFRQDDFPQNQVLYQSPLTPDAYVSWLRTMGVGYVVASDAPPDFSAVNEAALLQGGQSGLPIVFQQDHVTIYAVPDPSPMVTGFFPAHVLTITESQVVFAVSQPGSYRVGVRYSPYWRAPNACVEPAPDGMTNVVAASPGIVPMTFRIDAGTAMKALTGQSPRWCGGEDTSVLSAGRPG